MVSPPIDAVAEAFDHARNFYQQLDSDDALRLTFPVDRLPGAEETLTAFLAGLGVENARIDGYHLSFLLPTLTILITRRGRSDSLHSGESDAERFPAGSGIAAATIFLGKKTIPSSLAKWEETCTEG